MGGSHLGGIAFELSLVNGAWTENILHNFCSQQPNCADGEIPSAPMIFDASGNLYSTTQTGGVVVGTGCGGLPCGTVFELSPSAGGTWTETVLYSFCSIANCADGALPSPSALVFDTLGALYGTTNAGGTSGTNCNSYGCGTVFELNPGSGGVSETVLFAFPPNGLQGSGQLGGVVLDLAGNLYGTSTGGGRFSAGTVFKVTP
ncbi:MAG: choice-of-anchor tandem repeat GloVer-containing protein [Candidatus Sulfotelmatobacter sp.]